MKSSPKASTSVNAGNRCFSYRWEKGITKTGFFSITVFNELVFEPLFGVFFLLEDRWDPFGISLCILLDLTSNQRGLLLFLWEGEIWVVRAESLRGGCFSRECLQCFSILKGSLNLLRSACSIPWPVPLLEMKILSEFDLLEKGSLGLGSDSETKNSKQLSES